MKPLIPTSAGMRWLAGVLILFFALCPQLAQAAEPYKNLRNLKLDYAIYLGGMHVMDSSTDFIRKGHTYNVEMTAGLQGLIGALVPWDADVRATGRMEAETIKPSQSVVTTRWKNKPQEMVIDFNKDKAEAHVASGEKDDHEKIPKELMAGVLDPLSGVVQVLTSIAYGKGCAQVVPIYDGHRRFDLVMKDRGTETLDGEGYSLFSGTALRCEADLTMRAGSRKDREGSRFWEDAKNNGHRPPVYIYLAQMRDDLPAIPVRAETTTPFGDIIIHLTHVEGGTQGKVALAN